MKQKHNSLNNRVFKDNIDLENFKILLDSLNHVKPVYISREEYTNLNGDILKITGTDKIGEFYDLYLPNDLKVGELLNIINFLTTKFNIKKYVKIEELISKTKAVIGLITRSMSETESDEYIQKLIKEYNLDENFVYRIMGQKIIFSHGKEILTQIKSKRKTKTSKKLGTKEDINSSEEILSSLYQNEFDLTFFRKGVNMLRLGMMTITSGEIPNIRKKDGDIHINILPKDLDKTERLLRDKIGIDKLKKELLDAKKTNNSKVIESVELKIVNKIMYVLYEYPYQSTEENLGFKPSKILEKKEIYCTGFCLLGHAFLQELGIKHYGATTYEHTALEVVIGEKRYYFDISANDRLLNIKKIGNVGSFEKICIKELIPDTFTILRSDPEKTIFSHIFSNLGNQLTNQGKHFESIKMFEKAIELNPLDSNPYRYLGNSYFELGKYEKAIYFLNKAIELNPEEYDNYNNYGASLAQLKKYREAVLMYNKAISLNKKSAPLYINKSVSLYHLKMYREAIDLCVIALKIQPNYSEAYNNMGLSLIGLKNYSEAFINFDKAIKISPTDSYFYYNKGLAYEDSGNTFLEKLYKFTSDAIDNTIKKTKFNSYETKILKFIEFKDFDGLRIYLLSL